MQEPGPMPIYEYRCRACQERFEILQRLGDGAEGLECPRCGDRRLAKQYSTFASGGSGGPAEESVAACSRPGCGSGFT